MHSLVALVAILLAAAVWPRGLAPAGAKPGRFLLSSLLLTAAALSVPDVTQLDQRVLLIVATAAQVQLTAHFFTSAARGTWRPAVRVPLFGVLLAGFGCMLVTLRADVRPVSVVLLGAFLLHTGALLLGLRSRPSG